MKRFKIAFLLLSFFCLTACNTTYTKPNDTDLEYWISDRPSRESLLEKGYKIIYGWMGATEYLAPQYEVVGEIYDNMYYESNKPKEYVSYVIGGYPDCSDESGVVAVIVTDPKIRVYGLTIESEQSIIDGKMKKLGFKQDSKYVGEYTKGRLTVRISSAEIFVDFQQTNRENIVY